MGGLEKMNRGADDLGSVGRPCKRGLFWQLPRQFCAVAVRHRACGRDPDRQEKDLVSPPFAKYDQH